MRRVTIPLIAVLLLAAAGASAVGTQPDEELEPEATIEEDRTHTLSVSVPLDGEAEAGGGGGGDGASCGGTAPPVFSCSAEGELPSDFRLRIVYNIGFHGTITNEGSTSTGSWSWTCQILAGGVAVDCGSAQFSGGFSAGQPFDLKGETDHHPTTDALPVGSWSVEVT